MKYVAPSIRATAFNCPNCGALVKQEWCSLQAVKLPETKPLPEIIHSDYQMNINVQGVEDPEERERMLHIMGKLTNGWPVLSGGGNHSGVGLQNVFVARCFNCKDLSVWIHEKLVFPQRGEAPRANPDLSDDIRRDYDEASSILDLSPRGAAALLRLAIQKLCLELGLPGKNLNKDIGTLVSRGLDKKVQMSLDVVRVIGNNAVHPGEMDLRDDRSTAESLFTLLNLIAERMLSGPKRIKEAYENLPEGARNAIENRDSSDQS